MYCLILQKIWDIGEPQYLVKDVYNQTVILICTNLKLCNCFYHFIGTLGFLLPEYELVTDPENDDEDQQSDDEKYSKYLDPGGDDKTADFKIEELQKMAVKETKEDKTFLTFKKKVDKDPDQVCYTGAETFCGCFSSCMYSATNIV